MDFVYYCIYTFTYTNDMLRHIKNYLKATGLNQHEVNCEICGSYNSIDIHHIQHKQKNNALLDEAHNLIALCRFHHSEIHSNNTYENKQILLEIARKRNEYYS